MRHVRRHAGNAAKPLAPPRPGWQRLQKSPGVGMPGIIKNVLRAPRFHNFPRVHDGHPVGHARHHAQIVRDEHDGRAPARADLTEQIKNMRLHGDVERRGRLVGKQHEWIQSQRHGQHAALTHAAGKAVRLQLHALLRAIYAHKTQKLHGSAIGLASGHPAAAQRLRNLTPHRHGGIQRRHGILKHHGKEFAPQSLHLPFGIRRNVFTRRKNASAKARPLRQQLHDRPAEHGLAAARFPHYGQNLARVQRERNAPHRMQRACRRVEIHFQILYLKNRFL